MEIWKKVLVFKLVIFKFVMKSLFSNKGPFDINFIISKTSFSEKKICKKKIINISNLVDSNKDEITFFDNIKYINDLKTKASFCLVKKNLSHI